jgi:hypothetical protein
MELLETKSPWKKTIGSLPEAGGWVGAAVGAGG